jgi:hypothetical protein
MTPCHLVLREIHNLTAGSGCERDYERLGGITEKPYAPICESEIGASRVKAP